MRSAHNRFKLKRPTKRSTPSRLHWESLEPRLVLDSTVVFNELMYHPVDDQTPEWVNYNQNAVNMDLSGWSPAGGIDCTFPQGTVLVGRRYLVVAPILNSAARVRRAVPSGALSTAAKPSSAGPRSRDGRGGLCDPAWAGPDGSGRWLGVIRTRHRGRGELVQHANWRPPST
jgi:hypothetical protein